MHVLTAAIVAGIVATLLWLNLDSGRFGAPADRLVSMPLIGLGLVFGGGAWASVHAGMPRRAPALAGLALGVGGYGLLRLVLF